MNRSHKRNTNGGGDTPKSAQTVSSHLRKTQKQKKRTDGGEHRPKSHTTDSRLWGTLRGAGNLIIPELSTATIGALNVYAFQLKYILTKKNKIKSYKSGKIPVFCPIV